MSKFILAEELEKVKDKETQKLLEEVISCYSNGNYRATIVTLYTTMMYDLLKKINVLSDYYDIPKAKALLAEISTKKKNAPKSPQWEDALLQGIKKINLVSNEEYDELQNLKTNRNYAAHPIVSLKSDNTIDYYEMKSISRETAADMIRKAFEIVFLRDPVIAININEKIENDIKNFYDTNGTVGLEDYLCTKYIRKMTTKPKEMLFNFLWKMSFAKDDFEYRQAYVTSLYTLCKSDVNYFSDYLKNNENLFGLIKTENIKEYKIDDKVYEAVISFKKNSRLVNLIYFLERLPQFMATLDDYIKSILYDESRNVLRNIFLDSDRDIYSEELINLKEAEIEQIKLFAEHLYGVEDIKNHFKEISRLSSNVYGQSIFDKDMIERMYIQADYFGYKKELTEELINNIANARSYAEADDLLENIPTLKRYFDFNDRTLLLNEISKNDQFTGNYNYNQIKQKLE